MRERDGETTCITGDMGLSRVMLAMLTEYCESPPQPERTTTTNWGGRWHCPVDGAIISASRGQLPVCPECDRVLSSRIIHQLIELHPHR